MTDLQHKITARLAIAALVAAISLVAGIRPGAAQSPGNNAARFGLAEAGDAFDAADASGAGWQVVTLQWAELQPVGPNQWLISDDTEETINRAIRDGREVVLVLVGTPGWATNGPYLTGVPAGLNRPISDSQNLWANFVRQVVTAYAAHGVNRYAIWSDQDIPLTLPNNTWAGSLEEYYQLVKVAYQVAHQVNPNAQIHLGGIGTFDGTWLGRYLDVVVADETASANNYYFDVVTLHHFYLADDLYQMMQNQFGLMQIKGVPLKEVWVNKTNARPAIDPAIYPAGTQFSEHGNITTEQQAAYIIQAYALGFAANRGARIATYRLVDDLTADNGEGYGLLRTDGSARPAYTAYRLAARYMGDFTFARRLESETAPLVDYVRLTFEDSVTHIAWARTATTATLIIPARTAEATLVDMFGNEWTVTPQDGAYRIVVGGAVCDDPQVGCLIGGDPWFLIEKGIPDALNSTPEKSSVESGGTVLTPSPEQIMTATARALPSPTPTLTPTATYTPSPSPSPVPPTATATEEPPTVESVSPTVASAVPSDTPGPEVAEVEAAPTNPPAAAETVEPPGIPEPTPFSRALPYLLIGLGALSIGFGVWYYLGRGKPVITRD